MCSVVGISEGGRDGEIALSEHFTVDVSVWAVVVSEVLRANQDSSFLECFLSGSLKLADAKHALTETLGPGFPSERHIECCEWHSTRFHN